MQRNKKREEGNERKFSLVVVEKAACIQRDSRFLAKILTWTKRKPTNKKHLTEAVLSTEFHCTPSSHRKVRPHIRFLLHPLKTVRFCSSRRTRAHCYMFSCCSNLAGLESVESDLQFSEESGKDLDDGFLRRKEVRSVYLVTYSEANMETYPVTWKLLLRS